VETRQRLVLYLGFTEVFEVEIAKFILAALGTFLSVLGFSFAVFQYWKKKQEEKFDLLKKSMEAMVQNEIQARSYAMEQEAQARSNALNRLDKRIEFLEQSVLHSFEKRLSIIEGELRGIKPILLAIQNWFVNNNTGKQG
jgi:LPS O-antigen subunit length determinant protein (WzzB/FepE family)